MRIVGQGTVPADGFTFLRSKGPDVAVVLQTRKDSSERSHRQHATA
jgi:hypothetical protein